MFANFKGGIYTRANKYFGFRDKSVATEVKERV